MVFLKMKNIWNLLDFLVITQHFQYLTKVIFLKSIAGYAHIEGPIVLFVKRATTHTRIINCTIFPFFVCYLFYLSLRMEQQNPEI